MTTVSKVPEVTKDNIRAADMDKNMMDEAIEISRKGIQKYEIER